MAHQNVTISVCKKLREIYEEPDSFVSIQDVIEIRNYLMTNNAL